MENIRLRLKFVVKTLKFVTEVIVTIDTMARL